VFCIAKYRGGVRRTEGLKISIAEEAYKNITLSLCFCKGIESTHKAKRKQKKADRSVAFNPPPLLIVDEIEGVHVR